MVRRFGMWMAVALPVVAHGGTPRAPAPVVDAPADAPAPQSRACAPQGHLCVRVAGDRLVFQDGVAHVIPPGADRVVVAVDRWTAFVAPVDGWPAVHVVSPDGVVRAVTNTDLVRSPGRAPEGFVPPPVREGDLRIEGDAVAWTLPDGQAVRVVVAAMASRVRP